MTAPSGTEPHDPAGDLHVRRVVIPGTELTWRFDTSGGPGGQHANRSSTRVTLEWDVGESASLDEGARRRLLVGLGSGAEGGVVRVTAGGSRSQWRNRWTARERLRTLLDGALRPLPPARRATKPSRGARARRLEGKRRRGHVKRMRRRPSDD